ncbi:hypothetical protein GWK47_040150 [Chionoecetes opilio]|uniref:Uncharacterized protein n=1 Tax=Chionoecetes opilio TaxID=41210 RepID=A0A8J4YAX2_CHIOP|nr:hypothetical protein GWK47_040150 [Chionoecetes opilio]
MLDGKGVRVGLSPGGTPLALTPPGPGVRRPRASTAGAQWLRQGGEVFQAVAGLPTSQELQQRQECSMQCHAGSIPPDTLEKVLQRIPPPPNFGGASSPLSRIAPFFEHPPKDGGNPVSPLSRRAKTVSNSPFWAPACTTPGDGFEAQGDPHADLKLSLPGKNCNNPPRASERDARDPSVDTVGKMRFSASYGLPQARQLAVKKYLYGSSVSPSRVVAVRKGGFRAFEENNLPSDIFPQTPLCPEPLDPARWRPGGGAPLARRRFNGRHTTTPPAPPCPYPPPGHTINPHIPVISPLAPRHPPRHAPGPPPTPRRSKGRSRR